MSEAPATAAPAAAPKKKSRLLFVILAAVLVLGAGGGVTAYWATHRATGAAEGEAAPRKAGDPGLISLEPFVVNLADQGGSRFLRVSVRLITESPEQAEKIQKSDVTLMRARSSILEVLTQQTADRLVTAAGKAALKQALLERTKTVLEGATVIDVLFSDFVVQF
jgi:flagellar FliL protein